MASVLQSFGLENEGEDNVSSETGEKNNVDRGDVEDSTGDGQESVGDGERVGEEDVGDITEEESKSDTPDVSKEKGKLKTLKSIEEQLSEEKGFRTRLQRELKDAKEQITSFGELRSRFDELRGELNAKKETEEESPQLSYEEHPLEYLKAQIDLLKENLGGMVQHASNNSEISQHQQRIQALLSKGDKSFAAYTKINPDFTNAMVFLRENRLKQFEAMGYSEEEAGQILSNEIVTMLDKSYKGDQNPAEVAFQIAKLNGYRSLDGAKQTIKKVGKGQNVNKTLSNSGSSSAKKENLMTLEDLAGLNDSDFDKYWANTIKGHRSS